MTDSVAPVAHTDTLIFTLTVVDTLAISGAPPKGYVGELYGFTPTVNGGVAPLHYTIASNPLWLHIDADTGALSGTPAAADAVDTPNVAITVTDSAAHTDTLTFTLTVLGTLDISGTPPKGYVGAAYSYTPAVTGGVAPLHYTIASNPVWLHIDADTGALSGNPAAADIGDTPNVTITVTDSAAPVAHTDTLIFTLTVVDTLDISGTPPKGYVGAAYSYTLTATGGVAPLHYTIASNPLWLHIDADTGALSGTPAAADAGDTLNVGITVTDSDVPARSKTLTFTLTVLGTLDISGTPPKGYVGAAYSYTPAVTGGVAPLHYTIASNPLWLHIDADTGALSGTPAATDIGDTPNVTITVTDSVAPVAHTDTLIFTLTVVDTLAISGAPPKGYVGELYGFTPTVNGGVAPLHYTIASNPLWLHIDADTGVLSGTPAAADAVDTPNVAITVTDSAAHTDTLTFTLTVLGTLDISGTPPKGYVGAAYSYTPPVTGGVAPLHYTIASNPAWLHIDADTGALSGNPAVGNVGDTPNVTITVTDSAAPVAHTDTLSFTLTVVDILDISGTPPTAYDGVAYNYTPTVTGGVAPLHYTIASNPLWLHIDADTGALSGTPAAGDVGTTNNVVITVTDSAAPAVHTDMLTFNLAVSSSITVTPKTGLITTEKGGTATFTVKLKYRAIGYRRNRHQQFRYFRRDRIACKTRLPCVCSQCCSR